MTTCSPSTAAAGIRRRSGSSCSPRRGPPGRRGDPAGRGGAGLINEGERYAEAVWQRHCPAEPGPPVWIGRFLLPSRDHDDFTTVTFPVTGPYRLGPPARRIRITEQEIAQLVGAPVDASRGAGFRPRPFDPEPEPRYEVAWVARLPRPEPFRNPQCMSPGAPWWRWAALRSSRAAADVPAAGCTRAAGIRFPGPPWAGPAGAARKRHG